MYAESTEHGRTSMSFSSVTLWLGPKPYNRPHNR
jgi:hypothetical protein